MEKENQEKRRIVQTEKGEKVDRALPDSFLGWQNQIVDRETVSKSKTISMGNKSQKNVAQQNNKKSERSEDKGKLSNLGISLFKSNPLTESDNPNWATPGTRPEDYIPGMKLSDMTALNTREYRFYGYFQRIRERLDRAWVPILRERLMKYYRSGRQLASDMDHTTKVMVTLNRQGEIVRVQILNQSGTRDLDESAIAAFNKAGPFPNPPRGMIDVNGEVRVPWDFILKT